MAFTADDRAAFAQSVPVYAAAATDGTWQLRSTEDDSLISSEHASVRTALTAAMERDDVGGFVKSANLRTNGEPDGVWRWLDATAEEDAPIDGARIGELAIWQMAESLNVRASSIPINGGGGPDGMKTSEAHGDAYTGGDHPANGFAHVGLVALHKDRPHLYIWSELLPEIAAEVDRGRLAYGSVRFGFEGTDSNDNDAAQGAVLISHALTNDPAVTTLTAGSERFRVPGRSTPLRARRSGWMRNNDMKTTIEQIRELHALASNVSASVAERYLAAVELRGITAEQNRGAIADLLGEAAAIFGLTAEEVREEPYKLSEAVWALVDALKVEEVLEANGAVQAPEADPVAASSTLTGEHRSALHGIARRGLVLGPLMATRAVEGMEGDALDAFAQAALDFGRVVLSMPDAPPDKVIAKLMEREETVKAAIDEADADTEEGEEEAPEADPSIAASAFARMRIQRNQALRAATELRAKVSLFETRDWLDAELAKREKSLPDAKRDRYVAIAIKSGRETVLEFLDDLNMPPQNPINPSAAPRPADVVKTPQQAWDACMPEARTALEAEESEKAKRERRAPRPVEHHDVRARAQDIAAERYPTVVAEA